jgi:DNA mismatch repair ATPase MutS
MGGKSVALKTVFLALLMTQLGYFPICERLQTPLYDFMAFESSQDGDLDRGLSSFGFECVQIRNHHRRSQTQNGLILMDEPCRGTNPAEATAIVQALCRTYGTSSSTFLVATHYAVIPAEGIRFYQVRGIRPEALDELSDEQISTELDKYEDLTRVRKIQSLMDYRLDEIEGAHQIPSGAIKIAELLGVDEELLREMMAAWQEDQWLNSD